MNAKTPIIAFRCLTPRECAQLQGIPDDCTLVPFGRKYKNLAEIQAGLAKMAADGPRYKALGNSMAVPRFAAVDVTPAEQVAS